MERIKEALEKARQAQSGTHVDAQTEQAQTPAVQPAAVSEQASNIIYSQTSVAKPRSSLLKRHRVIESLHNAEAETAYRMLRTQVLQRLTAKSWNALAVTSPGPEQGKTLTAINLAISLAREVNYTVLLVDLDMRNPSIHKALGLKPKAGISDYLLRDAPLNEILINPGIDRLVVLPGREALSNSSEMLKSPKLVQLVNELKSRYPSRIVIFDLPPLLSADDALAFSPYVDAALLVIEEGKTRDDEIEYGLQLLKGTNLLGTVLNKSHEKIKPYY